MVVKYMHHGDDLVEHQTREASFGAQCTNHSANSMCLNDVKTGMFYSHLTTKLAYRTLRPLTYTTKKKVNDKSENTYGIPSTIYKTICTNLTYLEKQQANQLKDEARIKYIKKFD